MRAVAIRERCKEHLLSELHRGASEFICKLLMVVVGTWLIAQGPIASSPHIVYRNAVSVLSLPYDIAAKGGLASLKGSVTFSNSAGIVVQDNTGGIWISFGAPPSRAFAPGDLVSVVGSVRPGEYSPEIMSSSIQLNGHHHLPPAKTVSFEQLSSGQEDAQHVSIDGTIRTVSFPNDQPQVVGVSLTVAMVGGRVDAILPSQFASVARNLIDADVRIVGLHSTARTITGRQQASFSQFQISAVLPYLSVAPRIYSMLHF